MGAKWDRRDQKLQKKLAKQQRKSNIKSIVMIAQAVNRSMKLLCGCD